jgi:hypothetical protein
MKKIFGLPCTAKSVMAMKCDNTDAFVSIYVVRPKSLANGTRKQTKQKIQTN